MYIFISVDDERYYLVNEIDRSMLLDFQMKKCRFSERQIRKTGHLPELRDISFIIGIKTGNIADGAENG